MSILLKNLIKEQQPVPAVPAPTATNVPIQPSTTTDVAPTPDQEAPATGTGLTALYNNFNNEIKGVEAQKSKVKAKYETLIGNNYKNKKVKILASKSQYFQPQSEYTIDVSGVKIDQHYDKSTSTLTNDIIFLSDGNKYFLKSFDVQVVGGNEVLQTNAPEEKKPETPTPEVPPAPSTPQTKAPVTPPTATNKKPVQPGAIKEGLYPEVTAQMDAQGFLHMWQGEVEPIQVSKNKYEVNGKESEVYVQNLEDVENIKKNLTPDEGDDLDAGIPITTTSIPNKYWVVRNYKPEFPAGMVTPLKQI